MFERKRPHAYLVKFKHAGPKREPGTRTEMSFYRNVILRCFRMCKRGYRATVFGTRAVFIRAVPKVFGSVNRP